jgi:hypothetical protein
MPRCAYIVVAARINRLACWPGLVNPLATHAGPRHGRPSGDLCAARAAHDRAASGAARSEVGIVTGGSDHLPVFTGYVDRGLPAVSTRPRGSSPSTHRAGALGGDGRRGRGHEWAHGSGPHAISPLRCGQEPKRPRAATRRSSGRRRSAQRRRTGAGRRCRAPRDRRRTAGSRQ